MVIVGSRVIVGTRFPETIWLFGPVFDLLVSLSCKFQYFSVGIRTLRLFCAKFCPSGTVSIKNKVRILGIRKYYIEEAIGWIKRQAVF